MNGTALITGCTSGIGKELALIMAKAGFNLVLVARNLQKLQTTQTEILRSFSVQIQTIHQDLAEPNAAFKVFERVQQAGLQIDYLVNNAGFGDHGPFANSDLRKQQEMIQVNVMALMELTHLFLPALIQRKKGGILMIASTASFQPGPYMSVYFATKAFVLHFSEALSFELRDTGVHVSCVCPGPTQSNFGNAAGILPNPEGKDKSPESLEVAQFAFEAFMNKERLAIHGEKNRQDIDELRSKTREEVLHSVGTGLEKLLERRK